MCRPTWRRGTVVNNLAASASGQIIPLGFAGDDGEGFELVRALERLPVRRIDHFLQTPHRSTFTYCKPLVLEPGKPPLGTQPTGHEKLVGHAG